MRNLSLSYDHESRLVLPTGLPNNLFHPFFCCQLNKVDVSYLSLNLAMVALAHWTCFWKFYLYFVFLCLYFHKLAIYENCIWLHIKIIMLDDKWFSWQLLVSSLGLNVLVEQSKQLFLYKKILPQEIQFPSSWFHSIRNYFQPAIQLTILYWTLPN